MPEIERFGSFKILMYFKDENPPDVHIKGADFVAKVRISNGEVIAGSAPSRVVREARQWIKKNGARLLRLWNEFKT
jgi:hypothetical protein